MSDFLSFARAHGVLIRDLWPDGRIHRVPTAEKPRKRNGAYRFDGSWGWVQSWDTMVAPAIWRDAERPFVARRAVPSRAAAEALRLERERAAYAAKIAQEVVATCRFDVHPYLARKGLSDHRALVDVDGRLVVPMRGVEQYGAVQSVQWIGDDGTKRFLPGGAARGAVFRIGSGADSWLCEGYATGLSVAAALRSMYWPATVVVCFSAGNLAHVASRVRGRRFVMADNDESETGQRTAQATGLPWVMPPAPGSDANDMHAAQGVRALAELMRSARTQ